MPLKPTIVQLTTTGADIQAALTALGAAGGGILQLGPGTYTITTGLTVTGTGTTNGVSIRGQGQSTTILWAGTDPTAKILTLTRCYHCTFSDFCIVASTTAAVGIYIEQAAGSVYGSFNKFENVSVDGVSGKIGQCVKIGGTDINNDFNHFDHCHFTNYSDSGVYCINSQSFNNVFLNCQIQANQYGNYGLYFNAGSYSVIGGWVSGNKIANFYLGTASAPINIQDCNSELSACFLQTVGTFAANWVTISGCRWASFGYMNASKYIIEFNSTGALTIRNCVIEQYNGPATVPGTIQWTHAAPDQCNLTLEDSIVYSTAANIFTGNVAVNAMVRNSFQDTGQAAGIANMVRIPDANPRGLVLANDSIGNVSYEDDYVMYDDAVVTY